MVTLATTVELTITELPDGVELKVGDEVTVYADLESKKETKTAVSYKLAARSLDVVKRGGSTIWK